MNKYSVVNPVLLGGVIITSGVIELNQKQAERLLEFDAIESVAVETVGEKDISEMSATELKAYAKEHGINLGVASKKEDVLAVIMKAVEPDGNVPD